MDQKALYLGLFAMFVALVTSVMSLVQGARVKQDLAEVRARLNEQAVSTNQSLADMAAMVSAVDATAGQLQRKLSIIAAPSGSSSTALANNTPRAPEGSLNGAQAARGVLDREDQGPRDIAEPLTQADDHPVVTAYYDDWGQSDWGRRSIASLEKAIPDHAYLTEHGGAVVADCKQTTCQIEWRLPEGSQGVYQSQMDVLAQARYEMLALTASSIDGVGQLATSWNRDGESIVGLTTTVRRLPLGE